MKPLKFGLIAAMTLGVLAPGAVFSQSKDSGVTDAQRKRGMAEAPAVAQAAGVTCQVADARFIGEVADKKAKTKKSYYEIDCSQGMGFVLETDPAKPMAFSCLESGAPGPDGKPGSLACKLPGNQNTLAEVAALAQKAGVSCTVEQARAIGQTPTNTLMEVLCQGGSGFVLTAGKPPIATASAEAASCLLYDEADTNVKCTLADKATRMAVVDAVVKQANNGCVVKDRRFVLTSKDNFNYFEASCQDGKGYIFKADAAGRLNQTLDCAKAEHVGGGCTLTDSRAARTEQAELYTRLAKAANFPCDVTSYGALPAAGGKDVVELVCANGTGGIGVFEAGKGTIYNCAHAQIAGYRCSINKGDNGASALTADLRKLGKGTCSVKDSRVVGKTAGGSAYIEVNCADGLAGYMIEYTASTLAPKEAIGCAFAKSIGGGCQLPGNKGGA